MSETILARPTGVCGMVYPVGSDRDALSGPDVFEAVILAELERSGLLSWPQGPTELEDMDISPYHHPDLGLVYAVVGWDTVRERDIKKVILEDNPDKIQALVAALLSEEGFDLHPDAAPGWHRLLALESQVRGKAVVLKTHFSTPSNSRRVLDSEQIMAVLGKYGVLDGLGISSIEQFQELWYNALVRGHLRNSRRLADVIIVSGDLPGFTNTMTAAADLTAMFTNNEGALRAMHSCNDWSMYKLMAGEHVDVVHWDHLDYASVSYGDPHVMKDYIDRGGFLVCGCIPQKKEQLIDLAETFGYERKAGELAVEEGRASKKREDLGRLQQVQDVYQASVEILNANMDDVVDHYFETFMKFINRTAHEVALLGCDENTYKRALLRQTFIGATCGYGSNNIDGLRAFSHELARRVGDRALAELHVTLL